MEPCMQEGRLVRIEGSITILTEKIDSVADDVREIATQIKPLIETVSDHDNVLYGEKGAVGMIGKEDQMSETLKELNLALKGYGKEPGLISVIETITKKIDSWEDDTKWTKRLIAAWIITFILGSAVVLFK